MTKVEKLSSIFYRVNGKKVAAYGPIVDPDKLLSHTERGALDNFIAAENRGLQIGSTVSTHKSMQQ